jgi:hypothetical protein
MEISTFLRYRPSWRGVAFVLALVVAAGGVAGYLVYRQPANNKGTASVFVGQILPGNVPDYLLRPVADNYQAALALPSVLSAAARASGESDAAVNGGLSSVRTSPTANIDVVYQSTRVDAIKTVLRVASREALIALAQLDISHSRQDVSSAQNDYNRATQALASYEALKGNDGSATHSELSDEVTRTLTALDTARTGLDNTTIELDKAKTAPVIFVRDPQQQSRIPDAARAAVTAGLIAAMIGFTLLVLVTWRRRPAIRWTAPSTSTATARHVSRN